MYDGSGLSSTMFGEVRFWGLWRRAARRSDGVKLGVKFFLEIKLAKPINNSIIR